MSLLYSAINHSQVCWWLGLINAYTFPLDNFYHWYSVQWDDNKILIFTGRTGIRHLVSVKAPTEKFPKISVLKVENFQLQIFFSHGKFVSVNHILQIFLSAENFLNWIDHLRNRLNWQPQTLWGCQFPVCNLKWLKIANFARLYYPHFTTFRNETLEYY
jgi:hypothetical protein